MICPGTLVKINPGWPVGVGAVRGAYNQTLWDNITSDNSVLLVIASFSAYNVVSYLCLCSSGKIGWLQSGALELC